MRRGLLRSMAGGVPPIELTDFIMLVKTDNAGTSGTNEFTVPALFLVDYTIITSDGQTIIGNGATTITFPVSGQYQVALRDFENEIRFNNSGDRLKLLEIQQWGIERVFGGSSGLRQFWGCSNMIITATDTPDFTGSRLFQSFGNCSSIVTIPNLNSWDFTVATNNCTSLFDGCSNFNQNISINFSAQTIFTSFLARCTNFNSSLLGSDFSNGNNFTAFLQQTTFNQSFDGVVFGKSTVNTNFTNFLSTTTAFNQPLTSASFPRPQSCLRMLSGASAFNSPITFPFTHVNNLNDFIVTSSFSVANYDALLIHIDSHATLLSGLTMRVTQNYTLGGAAEAARNNIIATWGWTINDNGGI